MSIGQLTDIFDYVIQAWCTSRGRETRAPRQTPLLDGARNVCAAWQCSPRLKGDAAHGRLIGFIFIGDLVKDISEQKFVIEQLEHHIAGDWGVECVWRRIQVASPIR